LHTGQIELLDSANVSTDDEAVLSLEDLHMVHRHERAVLITAVTTTLFILVPLASAQDVLGWINQDANWSANKQKLQAFGERFTSSDAMFETFRQAAKGGKPLTWAQIGQGTVDWSGIYTRTKGGLEFDPDLPANTGPATAKLTPNGQQVVNSKREHLTQTGGEYDPISDCRPPGTPRWFTEPFLKEYVVTPGQTWLMNEMVNDVRRIYTDGRPHTPEDDAYPSWNGDSIGFWDGETLVAHTKYLMAGQYQRGVQPNYSEQTTIVERWHKVDRTTLQADLWVFDPVNLATPWYTRQSWTLLPDPDKQLRIRYWDCRENPNNSVIVTDSGTTQFPDFTFVPNDADASSDEAIKKAQPSIGQQTPGAPQR
jgi:hypothetical protein